MNTPDDLIHRECSLYHSIDTPKGFCGGVKGEARFAKSTSPPSPIIANAKHIPSKRPPRTPLRQRASDFYF